ncbi:MAG: hypothetical protein NVS4B3_05960 [Gemmatimonadaceae bacterium]
MLAYVLHGEKFRGSGRRNFPRPTEFHGHPIATRITFCADRMASTTTPSLALSAVAQRVAALCVDIRALDVVIMDLRGVTDMADFFVVASGTSDTHVRSISERVLAGMKTEGQRAYHVEGLPQGRWVLLDYVDVVLHVFHPSLRSYYQLERLWSDAAIVPLDPQGAST